MTFPIFLAFHLAFGANMAFVTERRMRSTGEILGGPLIFTLAPVALISAPIGALSIRFAGRWFLHGAFLNGDAIVYERFQLGIMAGVALLAALCTVLGFVLTIAPLSRDHRKIALIPFAISTLVTILVITIEGQSWFKVSESEFYFSHPVFVLNLIVLTVFGLSTWIAKRFLSAPVEG